MKKITKQNEEIKVWAVVVACCAYLNVIVLSRTQMFTVVKNIARCK